MYTVEPRLTVTSVGPVTCYNTDSMVGPELSLSPYLSFNFGFLFAYSVLPCHGDCMVKFSKCRSCWTWHSSQGCIYGTAVCTKSSDYVQMPLLRLHSFFEILLIATLTCLKMLIPML